MLRHPPAAGPSAGPGPRRGPLAHSPRAQSPRAAGPTARNQVWVGDITYLPRQGGGWLYLAVWLDRCPRKVVGWDVRSGHARGLGQRSAAAGIGRAPGSLSTLIKAAGILPPALRIWLRNMAPYKA
ncbi:DDE-type integrase/transposase/recombinase [Hymenobacter actinosclerus]|uniref:DDE-type integrase/transposase/recombinase n=1 Tax=Hymenobacter actinosclerus TaxID=82805 RepID=UPI00373FC8A9